jgi:hypothetical protein
MPVVKPRVLAFTEDERQLALRLAVGVAVAWPVLDDVTKLSIIAQVQVNDPNTNLPDTKAKVEAFVAKFGAD